MGLAQDARHRRPGRQARDKDAIPWNGMGAGHLGRKLGQDLGLAPATALVAPAEPVPAGLGIVAPRLLRIDDDQPVFLGQGIHAGAAREIGVGLGAAVQHQDQPLRPLRH